MKALRIMALLGVLSMLLVMVPAASAAGPTGNWVSGIACQNMGTGPGMLSVSFYSENNATAALVYSDPNPVPVGGSRNYYTPSTFGTAPNNLPANFIGSGVVSSDQPMACNINTQTTGTGTSTDPERKGTAGGVSADQATSVAYVPQVMKTLAGTWSSYIAVQNTMGSTTHVSVTFKDRDGNAMPANTTQTFDIPAQSNKIFYQDAADNNLPANFLGSAVVTADGTNKIAVLVNLYNSGTNNTTAQLLSYNGVGTGGQHLFVPRFVRNYYGYNGGLSIQNIGGAATTVKITFHFSGNNYVYNSPSINPGAALALYATNIAELAPVDALSVGSRFGSADIEAAAGGTVVATVNEDNRGGAGVPAERVGQGGTYNAPVAGTETTKLLFPQVTRKAGGIYSGGFQVANTTATAGTCTFTYAGVAAATETNVPLPASGSVARYGPNVTNLPDGFNAAVTVECTQKVVGIANLSAAPGTNRLGDSSTVTTGINQ